MSRDSRNRAEPALPPADPLLVLCDSPVHADTEDKLTRILIV